MLSPAFTPGCQPVTAWNNSAHARFPAWAQCDGGTMSGDGMRRWRRRIILATVAAVAAAVPAIGASTATTAGAASATPIYLDTHFTFAERAADLVSRMTLSEKVLQLHTNN